MKKTSKLFQYSLIGGTLLTGAPLTFISNLLFQQEAKVNGQSKKFKKPILLTAAMSIGMFFALFVFLFQCKKVKEFQMKSMFYILASAACDMVAVVLQSITLNYLYACTVQTLRGSILFFTWFLSIKFLKKSNENFITVSILILTVGIGCVGVDDFQQDSSKDQNIFKTIVYVCLTVCGSLLQALHLVIEDYLLHEYEVAPNLLVGLKGMIQLLACIVTMIIMQVIPNHLGEGVHEDTLESFQMMKSNPSIIWYLVLFILICFFFNVFGMMVTDVTNAVVRSILEGIRAFIVTAFAYILHSVNHGHYEGIDKILSPWSVLDFVGLLLLIFGLLIYNEIINLPFSCFAEETQHGIIQSTLLDEDLDDGNENLT